MTDKTALDEIESNWYASAKELNDNSEQKMKLDTEAQLLEKQLRNITHKENELIEAENHLNLSLYGLQLLIEQTRKDYEVSLAILQQEQAQLRDAEQKIEALRKELDKIENELKKIEKELEFSKQEYQELMLKQNDLKQELEQSQKLIDQLKLLITEKEANLQKQEGYMTIFKENIARLNQQLEALRLELQNLVSQLAAETEKLQQNEVHLRGLKDDSKSLEAKKQDLENECRQLEDEQASRRNELKTLNSKLENIQSLLQKTQSKINACEDNLATQQNELRRLEVEHDNFVRKEADASTLCDELRERKETAQKNAEKAEAEEKEANQQLTQLKQAERDLQNEKLQAKRDEQTALCEMNNAEQAVRMAEEEVRRLESRLTSQQDTLGGFWNGVGNFFNGLFGGNRKQNQERALRQTQQELSQARKNLNSKTQVRDKCKQSHNTAKNKTADLSRRATVKSNERANQEKLVENKVNQTKTNQTKLVQARTQHADALKERTQVQTELKLNEKQITRVEREINKTSSELQQHQQQFTNYESQKENLEANIQLVTNAKNQLDRAISQQRQTIRDNQHQLTRVIEEEKQMKVIIDKLKQSVVSMKQVVGEKENQIKAKEREITNEHVLADAKKKSIQQLKQDIVAGEKSLEQQKLQYDKSTADLNSLAERVNVLQRNKTVLEQDKTKYQDEIKKYQQNLNETRARVQQHDSQVKSLKQVSDTIGQHDQRLAEDIRNLQTKINHKKQEIIENNSKMADINKKMNDIQQEKKTIVNRLTSTKNNIEKIASQMQDNHTVISQKLLRDNEKQLNEQLNLSEQKLQQLKQDVETYKLRKENKFNEEKDNRDKIAAKLRSNVVGNEQWFRNNEEAKRLKSVYDQERKLAADELERAQTLYKKHNEYHLRLDAKKANVHDQRKNLEYLVTLNLEDQQKKLSVKYGRGLLLYGPPGTGKSELLKKVAIYAGITMITPPLAAGELNRPLVGETERLLVDIMHRAVDLPYLICAMTIDEIDGLAPKRDNKAQQSKVDGISVLLSHIEGVKNIPNLIVFGATNRRNMMDEAFLRRMQAKVFVGRPSPGSREKMLNPLISKDSKIFHSKRIESLKRITTNFSGAAVSALKSAIIVEMDRNSTIDDRRLLELAAIVAREFNVWFGISTLPDICRLNPTIFYSEKNTENYSLALTNFSPSGRILIDYQSKKCLIELTNAAT
ncbi:unnamed protein product, partial [Rotaria sp. Silwood1]